MTRTRNEEWTAWHRELEAELCAIMDAIDAQRESSGEATNDCD